MKTQLTCIAISSAFCFFNQISTAQTPQWDWAKTAGGTESDIAYSVASDANGNVLLAGSYSSSTINFGTNILTNANSTFRDVFLAKYDASGNVLWAKSAGGNEHDAAKSIAADASGNIYITGYFTSPSITFGNFTLTNTTSTFRDIFIVKYDANGNVLWAKSAGGVYHDEATSVATDNSGNVFVTGFYLASTIIFDTDTLSNVGNNDAFLVKFDATGNVLWAKGEGDSDDDRAYCVTSDAAGNVVVGGAFKSNALTIGSTTLNWAGGAYSDIFIAKYDSAGNVLWAAGAGGDYLDEPDDITTDGAGNIYMSGIVYSTYIVFGTDTLFNSGYTFYGDLFVVKYDANGNVIWSHGGGAGSNNDWAASLAVNPSGNICMTGFFGSSITFGSDTLNNAGVFVVLYDNGGNVLWAIDVADGMGNSIVADNNGNMYVAGSHYDSTITFGNTTLNNAGSYDLFLANLTDSITVDVNTFAGNRIPVRLFPNPFTESMTISFDNDAAALFTAEIFDINGKKVMSASTTDKRLQIKKNKLATGMYFLQLRREGKIVSNAKILIQ